MFLREAGRRAVNALALVSAYRHILRYRLLARLGLTTFLHAAEAVGKVPLFFGYRVRQRFYGELLAECGQDLEINFGATVAEPATRIGDRVWVGTGSYLDLVNIGDEVLIGPHVTILAGGGYHRTDRVDLPIRRQGNYPLVPTAIGTGAWIGAGAVLLADVGEDPVVFWIVEAVATNGPVSEERKAKLVAWAEEQNIRAADCRFLSAFISRADGAAKRRLKDLATGTFAWYADEPEHELAWYELG